MEFNGKYRGILYAKDNREAQVAELVDALGSGPSGSNTVQVRVLFWAKRPNPYW